MKWIIVAVILFCGSVQAVDTPKIIENVARHKEFMAEFSGYEGYHLYDVYELRPDIFGVIMLDPAGFREVLVYDTRKGKREVIYRDTYVPNKAKREEMRRESILVADAVRIARVALRVIDNKTLY
jgi:hypothetical protein